jgi:hypothetical protein
MAHRRHGVWKKDGSYHIALAWDGAVGLQKKLRCLYEDWIPADCKVRL